MSALGLTAALALAAVLAPAAAAGAEKPALSIVWFAWPPCQALQQLVQEYPDANVTVRCIPLAQWHDQIFTDFAARGGADLPILDSQWIGEGVVGGHLLELTSWMKGNVELADYVPAALSAYGEYPLGSGRYYGVPVMGDVQMLVYRKDLFEKAGFNPPKTWTELLRQAQYFKNSGMVPAGFVWFWCGSVGCVDQVQTAWNQIAWSFGGEIWDPGTYRVEGVLDSPENVRALEFASELFKTGPVGSGNFTYTEVVDAICTGQAAMTSIWVGFGPAFLDTQSCREAPRLGFAVPPGERYHYLSLGGMGISVSAYTKNREAALRFLKWLQSEEGQMRWAALGGYSARRSVLASDLFLQRTPYNPVFERAYQLVKDFWNLPEYSAMLAVQGEWLNLAITGQVDPKTALSTIAREQQKILNEAYPHGPPK